MAVTRHLGMGVLPDVAFHEGQVWCAYQHGLALMLVAVDQDTLEDVLFTSINLGPEAGAFARLLAWEGRLWLAYRAGGPRYEIILRQVGGPTQAVLGVGHGNDCVALGFGDVAWQSSGAPDWQVTRQPLSGSGPSRVVRKGAPTGLSRVLEGDRVTLVDEERLAVEGHTRPCWAGDLVVAEGKQTGAFCRLSDGRVLELWPGQEAFTPRCATDGQGRYVVATWGREGVRLGRVSADEFRPPIVAPKPERLPEGTELDLLPFLVGDAATWPRYGDHYMHQAWDGRNLHFMKFGPVSEGSTFNDNWERLVLDGDQFFLREDRSQSGAGIYSFHPGTAFKRRMRVGQWIDVSHNVLQRYEKGTCRVIDQHPLPYRLGLVEAWRNFDCGGDLGIRDVIKCSYDPGDQHDTIEHFWYARGAGWFRWQVQEQDDPTRSHTQSFNRIGGQALTPTQGCWRRGLVPWPPNEPEPKPEPKPQEPPPDPVPHPGTRPMRKTVSLKSAINDRVVCADRNLPSPGPRGGVCVRANRDNWHDPGPWEQAEVEFNTDGSVSFRSPISDGIIALWSGDPELGGGNQYMLCANRPDQPDDQAGPAERWEVVHVAEATRFNGTEVVKNAWALKNAFNGKFLTIDPADREGKIYARGDGANENELFYSTVPLARTSGGGGHVGGGAVDPGPGGALTLLRVSGRHFANDAGLFDYRELSAFGAYARWLQGRLEQLGQLASVSRAHKVTSWRVILTLSGPFWQNIGTPCGPSIAGFYDHLVPFTRWCASQGLYVRFCPIGGIEEFGGNPVDRRDDFRAPVRERAYDYLRRVVTALAGEPNILWNVANEWNQIGLRDSFDRVVEMGRIIKSLAPHHILNLSETNGPIADDPMWVREPADFVDAHLDRRTGIGGFEWVKRSSESPVVDNDRMPFLSGEPINFGTPAPGRPDDCEPSPAVAFCYGATSKVKRYNTTFHYHGGLTADVPDAATQACLDGWRRGLDAIPIGFPGGWCNGHHGCSPWDIDNFPREGENEDAHGGPIRIFGLSGGEGYIGVSVREKSGRRPRERRPVQEIDRVEWGGYASAVYRA